MKERAGTVHVFADYESCVQALTDTSGNILLTTGSKELAVFAPLKERLFVRVLPGLESIGLCEKAGIRGKQILAMQGPFSEEMNLAMIHQFSIRYLVTKASGAHSGFQEKLAAAQKAGITACVIGKQEQEQGMSYAQVTETLSCLLGHAISGRPEVEISLIGIGMSAATLTQEAKRALEESDVVLGQNGCSKWWKTVRKPILFISQRYFTGFKTKGIPNGWPETESLHIIFRRYWILQWNRKIKQN